MNGGGELYILYIIILAIVGIATLVRKAIEKASSGEKGKRMNLAQVVQRELKKYMQGPPPPRTAAPASKDADGEVYDVEVIEEATPRPRFTTPPPVVEKPRPPRRPEVRTVATLVDARRTLDDRSDAPTIARRPGVLRTNLQLDRMGSRRAIVLAEILGPPVSERQDYRLF